MLTWRLNLQFSWVKWLYDRSTHDWKLIHIITQELEKQFLFHSNLYIGPKKLANFTKLIKKYYKNGAAIYQYCLRLYLLQFHIFQRKKSNGNVYILRHVVWLLTITNSEILLPPNTPESAFFGFPDNTESFEIINHLHLIFQYSSIQEK